MSIKDKDLEAKLAKELKKVDKAVKPKDGLTKIREKTTGKPQGKAGK